MPDPSPLGARLKQVVDALKLSQREFAARAGVSQSLVGQLIRGDIQGANDETLAAYAKAGGVTIEWLVSGDGSTPARTVEHDPGQARRYPNVWEGLAGQSLEFRTFAEGRLADAVGTAATRKAIAGLNYMTETLRRDYDGARYQPGELMASWREAMRFVEGWEPAEAPTAPAPEPRPEPKPRAPLEERAAALRATAKKRKR